MLKKGLLYRDFVGEVNSKNTVTTAHIFTKAGKSTVSSIAKNAA